jgi:hypothetical protein
MESAVKIQSAVLLTQLPAICQSLHPLVCSYQNAPTPPQPELAALIMKTQNELLRCFEILGRSYTEQVRQGERESEREREKEREGETRGEKREKREKAREARRREKREERERREECVCVCVCVAYSDHF